MDPQFFGQHLGESAVSPDTATEQEHVAEPEVPVSAEVPEQEHQNTTVDYEARARELEDEARRNAERATQLESTLTQVNQWAQNFQFQQQQQAEEARYKQWWEEAVEQSQGMGREDQARYLSSQQQAIIAERDRNWQARLQQIEQMREQERRTLGKPVFIDSLVKQHGLSDDDRAELESLENPDDAARMAPRLKARREKLDALQNQINQLARTQQAGQLQSAGIGTVAGTVAPGSAPAMPEDPDERALWYLHHNPSGS